MTQSTPLTAFSAWSPELIKKLRRKDITTAEQVVGICSDKEGLEALQRELGIPREELEHAVPREGITSAVPETFTIVSDAGLHPSFQSARLMEQPEAPPMLPERIPETFDVESVRKVDDLAEGIPESFRTEEDISLEKEKPTTFTTARPEDAPIEYGGVSITINVEKG